MSKSRHELLTEATSGRGIELRQMALLACLGATAAQQGSAGDPYEPESKHKCEASNDCRARSCDWRNPSALKQTGDDSTVEYMSKHYTLTTDFLKSVTA